MNKAYFLENEEVKSRDVTANELEKAREEANSVRDKIAIRSCWNCNPAHYYFLNDLNDKFLFMCVMGCGNYYYQGIDITKYDN